MAKAITQLPKLMSLGKVAALSGMSVKWVRREITAGRLPSHKMGVRVMVSEQDYLAFIAMRREI